MRLLTLLLGLYFANSVFADAELLPVAQFSDLHKIAKQFGKKTANETLIVMDDDDTLTMMSCTNPNKPKDCQYLGGPAWYKWQSDLLTDNPNSPFLVAKTEESLLNIAALLLSLNDMTYTENDIPKVLKKLTKKGAKLLVLTARGPSNLSATEMQFSNLYLSDKQKNNFLDFINQNALSGKSSQVPSFPGPFKPADCAIERNTLYQQGVMYVAGQNKGKMLQCFLKHTHSESIKNIIFIDDTLANVEDVYAAFETSTNYRVKALHFTLLSEHKNRLTSPTSNQNQNPYQLEAYKRWQMIKTILSSELLDPAALNHQEN